MEKEEMDNLDAPRRAEIKKLKAYFKKREDVKMAFLFGSRAEKNRVNQHSDWDVAVYFTPLKKDPLDPNNTRFHGIIEWEEQGREYPEEDRIWSDVMKILKTDEVDLIVLNRCPSTIADSAIRGIPLVIKDRELYLDFMLIITREAEDFRWFVNDYYEIAERSKSITPKDRDNLIRTIDFMEKQLLLYKDFLNFNQEEYEKDLHRRNDIERWIENIMNASIDMAKVITGSEKKLIPWTYAEAMKKIVLILNLSRDFTEKFENWVKLRNILAHEYLDIKWKRIKNFIDEGESYFNEFIKAAKKFLKEK